MLSNEILANDLKGRMTACRRRLRRNRAPRIHFDSEVEDLAIGASEFSSPSENPAVPESLIRERAGDPSSLVDEPEVGIA